MKLRFSENTSARWLRRVQLAFVLSLLLLLAVGFGALRSESAGALVQGIVGNPLSLSLNLMIAIAAICGAVIILLGLMRAKTQEDLINRFFRARGDELMQGGSSALSQMPIEDLPASALSERLRLIVAGFRNKSRIDPATLAEVLAEREQSRLAVARYIASSLVLIGLLGTFVGLVVTVNGVTEVVSALDIGENSDMAEFMGQLKEGIRQPLDGMGLAFSTSLVGLAASLVLGVGVLGLSSAQASWTGKLEEITAIVSPTAASGGATPDSRMTWPKDTAGTEILERLIDASHFLSGVQKNAAVQLGNTAALVDQSRQDQRALTQQLHNLAQALQKLGHQQEELKNQGLGATTQRQKTLNSLDTLVNSLERSRAEQMDHFNSQQKALRTALDSFHAGVIQTIDARRHSTSPPPPPLRES